MLLKKNFLKKFLKKKSLTFFFFKNFNIIMKSEIRNQKSEISLAINTAYSTSLFLFIHNSNSYTISDKLFLYKKIVDLFQMFFFNNLLLFRFNNARI